MTKMKKRDIIRAAKMVYFILMCTLFAVVWFHSFNGMIVFNSPRRLGAAFVLLFALLFFFLIRVYEGVRISIAKVSTVVYSQMLSVIMADGVIFALLWLLAAEFPPFPPFICLLLGQFLICVVWSTLANKLYYKVYKPRKTVALYRDNWDCSQMWELNTISRKFSLQKMVCVPGEVNEAVLRELDEAEVVFVRGLPANERNDVIKYCMKEGIELYLWPKIGDIILSGAEHTHLFHVPMMKLERYAPTFEYQILKRSLDIFASLAGIIVLSPFMLITAAAIKAYDGGPALYKQIRLTKDGREFSILKFRSMRVDAEKDGVARLSTGDKDDRITPVGRIIRAIRFDELPQLFNILRGDMSIVGPRPERPEIAKQYEEVMPEFNLRLQAKAGLTGYAQVYGKYNSTPYDKLQMDLLYIAHPSFLEDIKLILATIKILFMKESTEGIAEGQTTANKAVDVPAHNEEETLV